jgi:uncharacterized protein (TIGR00730 family)
VAIATFFTIKILKITLIQIKNEYVLLGDIMPTIAIFGSSDCRAGSFEYDTAEVIGAALAQLGYDIVTGGYGGVMEAALKGASQFDVKRIGIITSYFEGKEANPFTQQLIVKDNYIDRLFELVHTADGYIVLPGGSGTLLELSLVWALKERSVINEKPIVCCGEQWFEVMQTMSFYSEKLLNNSKLVINAESANQAVEAVQAFFAK